MQGEATTGKSRFKLTHYRISSSGRPAWCRLAAMMKVSFQGRNPMHTVWPQARIWTLGTITVATIICAVTTGQCQSARDVINKGKAYMMKGDAKAAIDAFTEAIRLDSKFRRGLLLARHSIFKSGRLRQSSYRPLYRTSSGSEIPAGVLQSGASLLPTRPS